MRIDMKVDITKLSATSSYGSSARRSSMNCWAFLSPSSSRPIVSFPNLMSFAITSLFMCFDLYPPASASRTSISSSPRPSAAYITHAITRSFCVSRFVEPKSMSAMRSSGIIRKLPACVSALKTPSTSSCVPITRISVSISRGAFGGSVVQR